ncbi:hypothetical protein L1887_19605 [Cichorium endivia]|nr:hypothetical protein L1887_19605 [Cichorium endivia]
METLHAGTTLKTLEDDFDRSSDHGDNFDRDIDNEIKKTNDFLILNDHVEELKKQPRKTKLFYVDALQEWDAEFYVKVNDDILVHLVLFFQLTLVQNRTLVTLDQKTPATFLKKSVAKGTDEISRTFMDTDTPRSSCGQK